MADELAPDLVLMDVNLPGINGLDATRQILAENANTAVVLLLSTYEEEEYAPRAAECGAAAYIPKSAFGPDRLEAAWAAAAPPPDAQTGTCPFDRGAGARPTLTTSSDPPIASSGRPCPEAPCRAWPSPDRTRRRRR